ncbi:MAG: hypothetical protein K6A72_03510 [Lachnospiraceae bacterium]|nr:hypothetical protein [Lachnospiraceae bacterium]
MVRIDRLDKLDRINYYSKMHCHLVKWWNVNMVTPDSEEETTEGDGDDNYDPDAEAEKLIMEALGEDLGNTDVSRQADASSVAADPFSSQGDIPPDALEIYNRLMAEAAADEAAKQAEIEAAKVAAGT